MGNGIDDGIDDRVDHGVGSEDENDQNLNLTFSLALFVSDSVLAGSVCK